ncbi:hypothetical protein [Alicyclobacillus mengziensis]|uniref:Uncharacterized protein n=1 Tax=Alicyclobacillus mengziensis TaxID=2931921 RepID=A0A9X7VUN3_9BACL|nr:hypothetical protein [Alicyclobacillus mengziensis]QSO45463.1 hypothetical protein JZ786_12845 [Alicyclobacillus mengziensis]
MEESRHVSSEMLRISELADRVGMSVSTAHNYVRRYRDRLHPVLSKRGNLYPVSDVLVLRELYGQSSKRVNDSIPEDDHAVKSIDTKTDTETKETTESLGRETVMRHLQRLEQIEQQFLDTIDDLNAKYHSLLDQFDQLDRVISRSWETQRAFTERMSQSLDRVKQQDRVIDMLMERNKTLEIERARFMELADAYEEAAAAKTPSSEGQQARGQQSSDQPSSSQRWENPQSRTQQSHTRKTPEVSSNGFIRKMFRL